MIQSFTEVHRNNPKSLCPHSPYRDAFPLCICVTSVRLDTLALQLQVTSTNNMAYFGPAKSSATEASDYTSQGQRHDRIHNREDGSTGGPQTTSSAAIETSISQKMLSAVSGSVLTSLLGMTINAQIATIHADKTLQ